MRMFVVKMKAASGYAYNEQCEQGASREIMPTN